jgi:hypothetical protein
MDGYASRKLRAFCAATAVAIAGLALGASSASAEQIRFSLDDGRINLGQFKGEQLVDGPPGEPIAQLIGPIDLATGEFTAPATGLFVPPKVFESVEIEGYTVDVVAELYGAGPISGNFDLATGVLDTRELPVTARLSVYQAQGGTPMANLLARCQVSPVPVPIDTTGSISNGDPLNPVTYEANPFDTAGAAVATWDSLPASTPLEGPLSALACPVVDQMAGGPGGIWLSGIADLTADPSGVFPDETGKKPGARGKPKAKRRCAKNRKRAGKRCGKRGKRRAQTA